MCKKYGKRFPIKWAIKGPDNPTSQLLPIMSKKCGSRDGEGRKEKGGGGGSRSKTKLCVTKLYVKDSVWQRKMVCVCGWPSCVWKMVRDKERWCAHVWPSCVWKIVCVCLKVVCERERVTKLCMKDDVRQSGVGRMVCETTKRKVHCWIRKCKPAHSMNWV